MCRRELSYAVRQAYLFNDLQHSNASYQSTHNLNLLEVAILGRTMLLIKLGYLR
jgi:hypothetical protein